MYRAPRKTLQKNRRSLFLPIPLTFNRAPFHCRPSLSLQHRSALPFPDLSIKTFLHFLTTVSESPSMITSSVCKSIPNCTASLQAKASASKAEFTFSCNMDFEAMTDPSLFLTTTPEAERFSCTSKAPSKLIFRVERGGCSNDSTPNPHRGHEASEVNCLSDKLSRVFLTEKTPEGSSLHTLKSSCGCKAKGMRRILFASSAPKVSSTTSHPIYSF
ncbi:hypothetical protein EPI10_017198 [Gossypium australe]|uniref:Uncharacterized protein n=1 Tax=Gossypium australe TaxID=47621 RepID=A0A5B6VRQ7_9ROSI|nr:hypothetical protein EPI10_017198 [Gossypium australe]